VSRRSSLPVAVGDRRTPRREFHEALLDADDFEDLPGKRQAAILKAERNLREMRAVKTPEGVSG
jgi:hypothetical protein